MNESTPDADTEAERHDELASECFGKGQDAEAAEHRRRALALREAKYGPDSVPVADSLCRLSGVLLSVPESRPEAEQLACRALLIYENLLARSEPRSPEARHGAMSAEGVLFNLAQRATTYGEYREAEALYRRAQAISDRVFGTHPMLLPHTPPFAETLIRLGKTAEAEVRLRHALATVPKPDSLDEWVGPQCRRILASICLADGRTAEAEALYREALARDVDDKRAVWTQPVLLEGLARVCRLTGRGDEADQLEGRAAELRASAKG